MPILYAENKFYFIRIDYIQYFRRVIGENAVACVTDITIAGFSATKVGAEKLNGSLFEIFPAFGKLCLQTQSHSF